MKKIIIALFSLFALSHGAGVYDTYSFTDTEEKYALFFCNYYTSSDIVATGLASNDATNIINLRPISSLLNVSNISTVSGTDMERIREISHIVAIPDQNITMTSYNALGVKVSDFNYLMALCGLLIGFIFAFALITSIQNIAKGK